MEDNPYSSLIGEFQGIAAENNRSILRIGKVVLQKPLKVLTGDILLEKSELKVNHLLLNSYKQKATFRLSGGHLSVGECSGTPNGEFNGEWNWEEPLFQVGDNLIMLTEDDQTFYILCKVVPAE